MKRIKEDIIRIGRAMLALGMQNSHSGNISVRYGDQMWITKTGSMKGHLQENDIVNPGFSQPQYGIFQASSETGTHRRVLQTAGAAIHAHSISATLLSYLIDEFKPRDLPGRQYLETVPVVNFEYPVGSREMEEQIPRVLEEHPAMIIKTHGPVVRGANLTEAFFRLCMLDYAAAVDLNLRRLRLAPALLPPPPGWPDYQEVRDRRDTSDEELHRQFKRVAADLFAHRLSPFHTGSMSVRDGKEMLYCPGASVPPDLPLEIRRLSLDRAPRDFFQGLHQAAYRCGHCQAVLFTHSPEAMVQGFVTGSRGEDRIIPMDAEGGYLYPAIPVVTPDLEPEKIVKAAERYKMVMILGTGVLALGHTPTHCLHHSSSIRNICLIRNQLLLMENQKLIEDIDRFADKRGTDW